MVLKPHHTGTSRARDAEETTSRADEGRCGIQASSSASLRVTVGIPMDRYPARDGGRNYPAAFDSHFHLDRTARKLYDREDISMVTLKDILSFSFEHPPRTPVRLVGGVMVYCDPETRLTLPLMDGRWKVALWKHPKKVPHCTDSYLNQVKILLHSSP